MITAKDNKKIKEAKKLHQRKFRKASETYLIEGFHLVEEAHFAKASLKEIFVTEKFLQEGPTWLDQYNLNLVTPEIIDYLSELPKNPGIIAVATFFPETKPQDFKGSYLLLDRIQDPGNLGTMIRTADAFGLSGVVLGEGTTDLYQGKVLRALQGSQYHLPIYFADLKTWIEKAQREKIPVYGTELNEKAISLTKVSKRKDFCVILGNEGQGVSRELLELSDENIFIPMKGQAESFNVGVACGILLYELTKED